MLMTTNLAIEQTVKKYTVSERVGNRFGAFGLAFWDFCRSKIKVCIKGNAICAVWT